jgi:hypothetical protein
MLVANYAGRKLCCSQTMLVANYAGREHARSYAQRSRSPLSGKSSWRTVCQTCRLPATLFRNQGVIVPGGVRFDAGPQDGRAAPRASRELASQRRPASTIGGLRIRRWRRNPADAPSRIHTRRHASGSTRQCLTRRRLQGLSDGRNCGNIHISPLQNASPATAYTLFRIPDGDLAVAGNAGFALVPVSPLATILS